MNGKGPVLIVFSIMAAAFIAITIGFGKNGFAYSILSPKQISAVANVTNDPDIAVFGIWKTRDYDRRRKNEILSESREMIRKSIKSGSNYRVKSQLESDGLLNWIDAPNYAYFRDC